ncbi:MAG: RNA-binding S4 domain-containing protein [Leptolyngbyaceae cyanobacterium]
MVVPKHKSFIKLDQFLKWQQLAQTGGEAKFLIQSGAVRVNDILETRRGRKLIEGDLVKVGTQTCTVHLN